MGICYCGPWAEQIGDHEGYAAFRLTDGTLTGTWSAETCAIGFTAYVAACGCGWSAETEHPYTDDGEQAAERQWERDHLAPLIDHASRSWRDWADNVAHRAGAIADAATASRYGVAIDGLHRLEAEIVRWRRTAEQLAEGGA